MKENQKLDEILQILLSFENTRGQIIITIKDALFTKGFDIGYQDLERSLQFLSDEKMIHINYDKAMYGFKTIENAKYYSITQPGKMLIKKGGYKIKEIWESIENLPKRWGFLLTLAGLLAANVWQYVSYKGKLSTLSKEATINKEATPQNYNKTDTLKLK